jgi:hypothetical protein
MKFCLIRLLGAALILFPATVRGAELLVDVSGVRSPSEFDQATNAAVRGFAKRTAQLSAPLCGAMRRSRQMKGRLFLPVRVVLTDRGRRLPAVLGRDPGDIVPVFDSTGPRAFPPSYRALLERTFAVARPAMNATFGLPARAGVVRVRNYDADIQDRYAVAGGYYVPNAPGGPEIRLPVYNNPVAAAVNYIHTLLLAYQGDKVYPFDAYSEGLVRAATMQVARTPGSLPDAPSREEIEAVLEGLYDIGLIYDWINRPGLGSPRFIARNLLDTKLPPGGSTGGVYLLRYQAAGTAWAKALAEAPGFIAELNRRYCANPGAYRSGPQLEALAQTALDAAKGQSGSRIEGSLFGLWAAKQAILDTRLSPGDKLFLQPLPLVAQAGTSDFGAFDIVAHAFRQGPNGDETLRQGQSFPIYWRPDFTRFFVTAQDDVIEIAGGYGSVAPNFPRATFGGAPYRVTVDVPFLGRVARAHLPAGAYSTGASPQPRTFFGCLTGFPDPGPGQYVVSVAWVGGSRSNVPVSNLAFGESVSDAGFLRPGPLTVRVFRRTGSTSTEVLRRQVNKTAGGVGLELRPPSTDVVQSFARPNRLDAWALTLDPYRPFASDVLGLDPSQTLVARWNPILARNDLFPLEGELRMGLGYWVRPPVGGNVQVVGTRVREPATSVALNPGWNLVAAPSDSSFATTDVLVTVATEALATFADARAAGDIGSQFFEFKPDPSNPDQGALVAAERFDPGRAYFVRANRAEGAVLVFQRSNRGRDLRPAPRLTWEAQVSVASPSGQVARAAFGAAPGATAGFDPRFDVDQPPVWNGLAATTVTSRAWVRDIRAEGDRSPFRIRLSGLRAGLGHSLSVKPVAGRPDLTVVFRGQRMKVGNLWRRTFVPRSDTEVLEVEVGG